MRILECVHFPPQIEQLQTTLQAVSEQKSQLEDDLQRNMEMVRESCLWSNLDLMFWGLSVITLSVMLNSLCSQISIYFSSCMDELFFRPQRPKVLYIHFNSSSKSRIKETLTWKE